MIVNLALFFGYHVLWPDGFSGAFDYISAFITLAAALALFYWKVNLLYVIAACGLFGLLVNTLIV